MFKVVALGERTNHKRGPPNDGSLRFRQTRTPAHVGTKPWSGRRRCRDGAREGLPRTVGSWYLSGCAVSRLAESVRPSAGRTVGATERNHGRRHAPPPARTCAFGATATSGSRLTAPLALAIVFLAAVGARVALGWGSSTPWIAPTRCSTRFSARACGAAGWRSSVSRAATTGSTRCSREGSYDSSGPITPGSRRCSSRRWPGARRRSSPTCGLATLPRRGGRSGSPARFLPFPPSTTPP